MTEMTRWSIPFDYNQMVEDFVTEGTRDWDTIHAIEDLGQLAEFADLFTEGANWMKETNFDAKTCHGVMEMFIEPPADTFGSGWLAVPAYENIYSTLVKLTDHGYDVRPEWIQFRSAMLKIWRSLPDFYQGERVDEDTTQKRVMESLEERKVEKIPGSSWEIHEEARKKLYEKTELPPDYDPNKPFPQYLIPADIDEDVKKD